MTEKRKELKLDGVGQEWPAKKKKYWKFIIGTLRAWETKSCVQTHLEDQAERAMDKYSDRIFRLSPGWWCHWRHTTSFEINMQYWDVIQLSSLRKIKWVCGFCFSIFARYYDEKSFPKLHNSGSAAFRPQDFAYPVAGDLRCLWAASTAQYPHSLQVSSLSVRNPTMSLTLQM